MHVKDWSKSEGERGISLTSPVKKVSNHEESKFVSDFVKMIICEEKKCKK